MSTILVNRCYAETTPESVEDGEFSDTGTISENEEMTFRELVRAMQEHSQCSCYPASGSTHEWLFTGFSTTDFRTGTERDESLHYSRQNPPAMAKYWRKAMCFAGIIKTKNSH